MQRTVAEGSFPRLRMLWSDAGMDDGTLHYLFANQAILESAGAFEPYPAALSMKRRDDDFDDEEEWDEGDEEEWDDEEDLDEFDDEDDEDEWDDEDEDDEDWDEDLEDEDYEDDEDDPGDDE